MNAVLDSLNFDDALILTAPPGWGKTYKLLEAIRLSKRSVLFIFPLRALCDEVEASSLSFGIKSLNLRTNDDFKSIGQKEYKLIISTPEMIKCADPFIQNFVVILDEFHLFYYWGDTFRERMLNMYFELTSYSIPVIFLTATLGVELKERLSIELKSNYKNIYFMDFGNQKIKNYPSEVYFYPRKLKNWLLDDIKFSKKKGVTLLFCKYRSEVQEWKGLLESMDYSVLSCVGGEAAEFVVSLNNSENPDFIVATSVVSHGVNLPNITQIYFTSIIENLDFYIQMIGRGGRSGEEFKIHVFNRDYFSRAQLFKGFLHILLKRLGNKVNSLLYYAYDS
jgi:superfamily II DNA or RNA helicase